MKWQKHFQHTMHLRDKNKKSNTKWVNNHNTEKKKKKSACYLTLYDTTETHLSCLGVAGTALRCWSHSRRTWMMLPSCWETVGHHRGLPQLLTLPLHTSSCHPTAMKAKDVRQKLEPLLCHFLNMVLGIFLCVSWACTLKLRNKENKINIYQLHKPFMFIKTSFQASWACDINLSVYNWHTIF